MIPDRPRLLDLFCCEGGAATGYARAGFDVTGVDIVDHSDRYPFTFIKGDALDYVADHGAEFDAIHASPPCQAYSVTRHGHGNDHPELVEPTRAALIATDRPYVIENVVGAPLLNPITLCGSAFDLTAEHRGSRFFLRRHRLFESNVWLTPVECDCRAYKARGYLVGGVYGQGSDGYLEAAQAAGRRGYRPPTEVRAELIGAPWMTRNGLAQSIPPAYTEYLGAQLLEHVAAGAVA